MTAWLGKHVQVDPETRTYDVTQNKTIRIRGKEDEVDYR